MRGGAGVLANAVLGGAVLLTGIVVVVASQPAPPAREDARPVQLQDVAPPGPGHAASRSRPLQPLHVVRTPDLLVSVRGTVTRTQVLAVRAVPGVRAALVLSRGRLVVGGKPLDVLGADPSSLRAFTPRETASSDPLWSAVHRGELVSSYGAGLPLGADVTVSGTTVRVGGLAAFGLPGDAVVDQQLAVSLGLRPDSLVVAAPKRSISGLQRDVRRALGPGARVTVLRPAELVHRRPATYRELYQQSARYCPGLSWRVLAAIGQVESGHGRNMGPSSAGALGPMQFMPATWAWAGVDGDGDGKADVMNPYDAVPAAALYLCRHGAGRGGRSLYAAVYSYNHADWYVRQVLALAARYR